MACATCLPDLPALPARYGASVSRTRGIARKAEARAGHATYPSRGGPTPYPLSTQGLGGGRSLGRYVRG
jgi:hypothetical protein